MSDSYDMDAADRQAYWAQQEEEQLADERREINAFLCDLDHERDPLDEEASEWQPAGWNPQGLI